MKFLTTILFAGLFSFVLPVTTFAAQGNNCTTLTYYMSTNSTGTDSKKTRTQSTNANTGNEVAKLQSFLKAYEYMDQSVVVSGKFGPATKASLIKFQKSKGISPTGATGPKTREAIKLMSCKEVNVSEGVVGSVSIDTQSNSVPVDGQPCGDLPGHTWRDRSCTSLPRDTFEDERLTPREGQPCGNIPEYFWRSGVCTSLSNNADPNFKLVKSSQYADGVSCGIVPGYVWKGGACISLPSSLDSKSPLPVVTASFSPSTIKPTESTTFSYSAKNASYCKITHPDGKDTWDNAPTSYTGSFSGTTLGSMKTAAGLVGITTTITCFNEEGKSASVTKDALVTDDCKTYGGCPSVKEPQVNSGTSVAKNVDVFLIAGQSNAVGYGDSQKSTLPPSGKVLTFYQGTLREGYDPVGNAQSGSAWPAFGASYYKATGRVIVFVPTAVGGSSLTESADTGAGSWGRSGSLFNSSTKTLDNTLQALNASGYSPTVKGVLWNQGETDAIGINEKKITENDYKDELTRIIYTYRNHYGQTLPFYIYQTGTGVGESDYGYSIIRKNQDKIASEVPEVKIVFRGAVDFPARGLMRDSYHYLQKGYNEMGEISAQSIVSGQLPPPPVQTTGTSNACQKSGNCPETSPKIKISPEVLGTSTKCIDLTSDLYRGKESQSVSDLQTFLISRGLLEEKVSGFYGDKTIEAVKNYQTSLDLPATGMVYALTRSSIKAETCQ